MASELDFPQIIQALYDEVNNRLRVDAELTATIIPPPGIEVSIHASDDNIAIRNTNNSNELLINADGSINVVPSSPVGTQDTNLIKVGGNTVSTGNGIAGTGTQRVTIASDNSALSVNASQTGTWNVGTLSTITNVVHVDDNGGSITVDGTVTANQGTSPWVVSGTVTANAGTGTFAVSAAALPLPSGAATEATLSTLNGKVPSGLTVTSTRLLIDGSGVTQPISGSISVSNFPSTQNVSVTNASGASAVNIQDGGNSITVDGTVAATQSGTWNITNVSGTVSLPTGASTSALQTTGNSSLSSIDSKVPSNLTVTSTRLLVDGSGVTQPVSGTVTANAGTGNFTVVQATGTNLHTVVDSGTISTITNVVHVDDNGGSITVDGTIAATQSGTWNITNVSGTVSLPTGAATAALQTTGNTSLSSIDSKLTSPIAVSLPNNVTSGSFPTGITSATLSCAGLSTAWLHVNGTWSGTITFNGSIDGTNFFNIQGMSLDTLDGNVWFQIDDTFGTDINIQFNTAGLSKIKITATLLSGSLSYQLGASEADSIVTGVMSTQYVGQSGAWNVGLNAGTNSIGKLGANSGVDIGDVTLTAGSASIGVLGANSGVDIGDVTINNAAGASAVNIQDGGNSLTVDGTVAAIQSGTWTVTGAGGTFPITDSGGSITVDTTGYATLAIPSYTEASNSAISLDLQGNLRVKEPNSLNQLDILKRILMEMKSVRLATVALATEGQLWKEEDFDPTNIDQELI